MRAVVQRVLRSKVTVNREVTGEIDCGLTVLVGVEDGDTEKDAAYIADKVTGLRVFDDETGVMNRSVIDAGGAILAVSQFTLLGDCRKGKRPNYMRAARPEAAERLYRVFVDACRAAGVSVEEGRFRTDMLVCIENDGPVTILLDSRKQF